MRRIVFAVALVAIVAVGAVVANLALLRSTEDRSDPVGRLSPRAVFSTATVPATVPATSPPATTTTGDDGAHHETGPDD